VLRNPPEAAPGTKFIYSNQGYAIAGAMLEKVTDTTWEKLICERLFKALHMSSAGFGPPGTRGMVDQPWGHHKVGDAIVAVQEDNPPAIGPAGTVHCSLSDLAKYAELHLRGETSGVLLKPATFRKLHTPAPGEDYAGGWGCYPRPWATGLALTHSGSNTMWYVVMWFAPARDFAVIVATNTGAGDTAKGRDDVAAAMIKKWISPAPVK
jgi:CubicO group peptidase (beta-lactamase class C family)